MTSRAGLFLDRDGTIVADEGYMYDPAQIRLLPGAREALRKAASVFRLYLVTNQSGIGRGFYTLADFEACNRRMWDLLGMPESAFAGVCVAPEHPDEPSLYRKPSPRYVLEMIARDGLQPDACWMVGDRLSDLQCGVAAGIHAALVRQSGHSETPEVLDFVREQALPVFDSLAECVDTLLATRDTGPRGAP